MLNKNQRRAASLRLRREVGAQLHRLRVQHKVSVDDIYRNFSYYPEYIDRIERGVQMPLLGDICALACFFNSRIKIEFVPYEDD